jgi:putative DNA primase/helicase
MRNATGLSIVTAAELLAAESTPRRVVLAPLLSSDTAALVYGPPGVGKSFFALSLAWAVATGGSVLGWRAPRPHRVLYVDGGLGEAELRERLALFGPPPAGLDLCPLDRADGPPLDLSTEAGLLRLMRACAHDPELIVLDAVAGRSEAEPWDSLRRFLRYQRRQGCCVVLVHAANRNGRLRGSVQRAHDVNLVIALRHPPAGSPSDNARFRLDVEKTRRRTAVSRLCAELQTDASGRAEWRWADDEPACRRVARLLGGGLSAKQAAAELSVSLSTVYRHRADARREGVLP